MVKYIRGGSIDEIENNQSSDESLPQYALRQSAILGKSLASAAEFPKAIGDVARSGLGYGVEKLTGIKNAFPEKYELEFGGKKYQMNAIPGPEIGQTGAAIDQALSPYYSKEQLQPKGIGEKYVNRVARGIGPAVAMSVFSGPAVAATIGRNLISAAAGQGLEELGFGPGVQAVGELGTGTIYDFVKKGGNPISTFKWAKNEAEKDYAAAKPFEQKIKVDANPIVNALDKAVETASDSIAKDRGSVIQRIRRLGNNSFRGEMSLEDVIKDFRKVGKIVYGSNPSDLEKEALQPLYFSYLNALEETGKKSPEWGIPWFRAQGLSSGTKTVESLKDFFVKNPIIKQVVPNKTAQMILSTGLGLGGGYFGTKVLGKKANAKLLAGAAVTPMILQAYKSPAVLAHLKELGQAALTGDKAAIINSARGYNTAVEDATESPRIKVI